MNLFGEAHKNPDCAYFLWNLALKQNARFNYVNILNLFNLKRFKKATEVFFLNFVIYLCFYFFHNRIQSNPHQPSSYKRGVPFIHLHNKLNSLPYVNKMSQSLLLASALDGVSVFGRHTYGFIVPSNSSVCLEDLFCCPPTNVPSSRRGAEPLSTEGSRERQGPLIYRFEGYGFI